MLGNNGGKIGLINAGRLARDLGVYSLELNEVGRGKSLDLRLTDIPVWLFALRILGFRSEL